VVRCKRRRKARSMLPVRRGDSVGKVRLQVQLLRCPSLRPRLLEEFTASAALTRRRMPRFAACSATERQRRCSAQAALPADNDAGRASDARRLRRRPSPLPSVPHPPHTLFLARTSCSISSRRRRPSRVQALGSLSLSFFASSSSARAFSCTRASVTLASFCRVELEVSRTRTRVIAPPSSASGKAAARQRSCPCSSLCLLSPPPHPILASSHPRARGGGAP